MESVLVGALLFLLPFIVLPFGTSYFETPKVVLCELTIQIMLYYLLFYKRARFFSLRKYWLYFGVLTLSLLHIMSGVDLLGIFGNPFRLQGIFFLWNMVVFSLLITSLKLKKHLPLYPLFTLSGLFISVFYYGYNASSRSIGSLGEPNALAAAAVFCFTLSFFRAKKNYLKIIAFVMLVAILISTRSRSASIGFFVEAVFYFAVKYKLLTFNRAGVMSSIILVATSFLPFLDETRLLESRAEIWSTAIYSGLKYPLFGWGFGNVEVALRWGAYAMQNTLRFQYVDSAHNILLDWWLMGGAVGVVLLIAIIIKTLRSFLKYEKAMEAAAFIGILSALWFNPGSVYTHVIFWYLVGRSYLMNRDDRLTKKSF